MVNVNVNEKLGPAERIISTLLAYTDHAMHNRPGIVRPAPRSVTGVVWTPVTHKVEGADKVVYAQVKVGKKNTHQRLGVMTPAANGVVSVVERGMIIGRYQPAGLFDEVAAWMYRQIAEVWKLDNEFAARWASYAYGQEHKDLKYILAAFMLVQSRRGDPIMDAGKFAFRDADYRTVGEAMALLHTGTVAPFDAKLLLRVMTVLECPAVAAINRELGFGRSTRNAFLGRWPQAVTQWLMFREENPGILRKEVKMGWRTSITKLAAKVGYKPTTPAFFDALRWKQKQAKDGRRTLVIGQAVQAAETWQLLTEREVCERIVKMKPNWKRLVSLVPTNMGVTRAIMAAALEAGSLSDRDIIMATPTLEDLGLLQVQEVKERWERALKKADDMRAANIARNVKTEVVKEALEQAADTALQKVVEEVTRNMRVYVYVDISGSMGPAIAAAKAHLARFVQGFPMDRLHVCVFNTSGREVRIPHASAAGVENAFRGITAGGGTDYASGIRALGQFRPKEDEDALFLFVGDEQNGFGRGFAADVRRTGITPMAFGLVRVVGSDGMAQRAVQDTAAELGVPCFLIEEATFADPYAIPRTIRNLVAATPVGVRPQVAVMPRRLTLVDTILKTKLLEKPAWALPEANTEKVAPPKKKTKAPKPAEVTL